MALVNQVWVDEALSHFCPIERVLGALCPVSFWALGKRFWLSVHNWVFVGGWGMCVFLVALLSPNQGRQAWPERCVGTVGLFHCDERHLICQWRCHW